MTIDAIVTGHLCLDLIPPMDHVPPAGLAQPGRLFEVGAMGISTGGCVSNTGLALHRLGVNVRLMSAVGDDPFGGLIVAHLRRRDPSLADYITVRSGVSSSYTIVLSPARIDRVFLHFTGQNSTFDSDCIDFSLLRDARLLHLGYPAVLPRLIADDGAQLATIFTRAKSAGVVTSMDTSLPDPDGPSGQVAWRPVLERVMPVVDIFVPSIDEALFMLRRADFDAWRGDVLSHLTRAYLDDLARELIAMGGVIVGFKLGDMGVYLRAAGPERFDRLGRLGLDVGGCADRTHWAPAFSTTVVSTVGAGDAAYAGLLAALLRGLSLEDAARWACAVGACNVETADATSGIRSWDETQARMAAGWPVRARQLT